jgi:fructose-1,6-bisphosphatase/inositol monophosphatase family enzyme
VEEAGGVCRNSAGDELALDSKGVIATCPGITEELTEVVGWKESESD